MCHFENSLKPVLFSGVVTDPLDFMRTTFEAAVNLRGLFALFAYRNLAIPERLKLRDRNS